MENGELSRWTDEKMAALDPPDVQTAMPAGLRSRRRPGSRIAWAAAGAGALCLAAMALPGPRAFAERCLQCLPFASTEVNAQRPLAPDFTLRDARGRALTLSDYRGKVVLVNFWASWCPPCKTETPWLVDLHRRYADRGFTVIGVTFDGDWAKANAFAASAAIDYPLAAGDDAAAKAYGAESLPVSVLIDAEGHIAARFAGLLAVDGAEREIQRLLPR